MEHEKTERKMLLESQKRQVMLWAGRKKGGKKYNLRAVGSEKTSLRDFLIWTRRYPVKMLKVPTEFFPLSTLRYCKREVKQKLISRKCTGLKRIGHLGGSVS